MNAIQIEHLTKFYGKARGVTDLDLTVREGEFFGFIGPNGAGKSTTIRTLLGLVRPTAGSARVFGKSAAEDSRAVLASVGYLPAEAVFYAGLRVREVLRLAAGLRKKDCTQRARELCERLQLDASRKIDDLSFGNRKKVAIVAALQHDPALLVLDEPTGGLDPLMQREFFDILHERSRAGVTVFLSSHILSEIQRHCTRAAVIRAGRIVACDSVETLGQTSARRVTVRGQFDPGALEAVRDVSVSKDGVSFLYGGDIGTLLRALAGSSISDLAVSEPDLEEIFLHYYEGGNPS